MNQSRILKWSVLALLVLGFILLNVALGLFPTVQQVSSPEASTKNLTDDKAVVFGLVVGAILSSVIITGGGIAFIIYLLNRNVKRAEVAPADPRNPLEYRTYGMIGAFALPVGLALLWAVILLGIGILPEEASEQAKTVDMLFRVQFAVQSIIFGLVIGLFLHATFYFRAKEGDEGDGEFFHGNNMLEFTWTFIPFVIVMALGIWTAFLFADIREPQEGESVVRVTGQQWNWSFTYEIDSIPDEVMRRINPNDLIARNADGEIIIDPVTGEPQLIESFLSAELVLMVDQPVVFQLNSADVLHAFWIPQMRIKQDVVPGVVAEVRYTPNAAGEYQVVCTEMCGLSHSQMLAPVRVLSQADYVEWLRGELQGLGDPYTAGRNLWAANCASCHSIDGSDGTGPTWQGLYLNERNLANGQTVIADETYLYNAIVNPNSQLVAGYQANVMPNNFGARLSEVQINQIIKFIADPRTSGREAESTEVEAESETSTEIEAEMEPSEDNNTIEATSEGENVETQPTAEAEIVE